MTNSTFNVITTKQQSNSTHHQKAFNRLIKTVEELQSQQEAISRDLDLALQFYYETIKPDESILLQSLIERIKIAYRFYKTSRGLSKSEINEFRAWLTQEVNQICTMHDSFKVSDEMKNIFRELTGISYEKSIADELNELKKRLKKELGMHIDLSDINLNDSPENIKQKIFLKMAQADANQKKTAEKAPKTKKQLEEESQKHAIEEMQSKSLGSIYKQLVRVLHPDLEQNIEKRAWKEELMKKLTTAHASNDLYSLLTIEMEWINSSTQNIQSQNDESLKMYNAILEDQIKELQTTNDMLLMQPRLTPIQKFYNDTFDGIATLEKKSVELKKLIQKNQAIIPILKTPKAKTVLKEITRDRELNYRS